MAASTQVAKPGAVGSNIPVFINANENPLGPCTSARAAIARMAAQGGRYNLDLTKELAKAFSETAGVKPEYVGAFAGSSAPLQYSVLTFTSPGRSYVTANPGYEAGTRAAQFTGARVVKVPLTQDYAHDIPAMLQAAPDAGLFYVCNPNNPTGTLTPPEQIEYLVTHKPAGSIVMVDEAYWHFTPMPTTMKLAAMRNDVIVLRTFSKVYGMAGLRCGFAIAHPDLLAKLYAMKGWNPLSTPGVAAAISSLRDPILVENRRAVNAHVRDGVFAWMRQRNYSFTPSEANFFMVDTKGNGKALIAAMAKNDVHIGRIWPIWPSWVRVTVGTQEEMDRFEAVYPEALKTAEAAMAAGPLEEFETPEWQRGFVS